MSNQIQMIRLSELSPELKAQALAMPRETFAIGSEYRTIVRGGKVIGCRWVGREEPGQAFRA
jgi:hypothetical protein